MVSYKDTRVKLNALANRAAKEFPADKIAGRIAFEGWLKEDIDLLFEVFSPWHAQVLGGAMAAAYAARVPVKKHDRFKPRPTPPVSDPNARAHAVRLSLLDTFKINGQSIGDMTSREAMAWAGSQARDVRFVQLLTSNLPMDTEIRKFRTPEEAQKLYDEAKELQHV